MVSNHPDHPRVNLFVFFFSIVAVLPKFTQDEQIACLRRCLTVLTELSSSSLFLIFLLTNHGL